MAKFLHIHVGDALVHTAKLTPEDPTFVARESLIEQLLAELERMHDEQSGAATHDGGAQAGHPFYGNQYTDVVTGPKPTEAKNKKSVKAALHELLTSGHPFSLDELMAATGSKSKSNLTTAITHLKGANPHELGVLNILKNAQGQYHLDKDLPPGLDPYTPKPPAATLAETPKPAPPPPAAATPTPTGPGSFKAPDKIVPDDWASIDAADFHQNTYEQNISHVHKTLHAAAPDKVANKIAVRHALQSRLKSSPHFQSMDEQHRKKHAWTSGLAAALVSQWAGSSGDSHPQSVSAQLAIRDAFSMNKDQVEHKAFSMYTGSNEDDIHRQSAEQYGIDVSTPEKLESYKAGMRDFALAQYHETQAKFAELGIKELHLVRGMNVGAATSDAVKVKVKLQPASSFTTSHSTAHSFAGSGSLFVAKVPVSQVLGSFLTGYGCTGESEVVVLNHPGMEAIRIGKSNASSATQMAHNIKSTLPTGQVATKKAPPTPKAASKFGVLPAVPSNISGSYAAKAKAALHAGDLDKFAEIASSVPPEKKNTLDYIEQLKAHVKSHLANHN